MAENQQPEKEQTKPRLHLKYSVGQRFTLCDKMNPQDISTFEIIPQKVKLGMVGTVSRITDYGVMLSFATELDNKHKEWCFSEEVLDKFFSPVAERLDEGMEEE